ncbi:MAG: YdcF family protein [Planctomycetota bacterium]
MSRALEGRSSERQASPYFVVPGYSTTDSERYTRYLDLVAEHHLRRAPAYLVLCGGVTGKPETEISEAEWMARRLERRGIDRADLRLEERSRTTVENFVFARADGLLPSDRPAVIFCDAYRRRKILALASLLDLDIEALVEIPMERPAMGQLVRVKSAIDACLLRLLGVDSG